jgi:hypothetical protein
MLRAVILTIGTLMMLGGVLVAAIAMVGPALWLFAAGGLIVIGTVFERVLYKPLADTGPGPGWTDTGERFVDPGTGKMVDVFYNASTGERQYVVPNDAGPPPA